MQLADLPTPQVLIDHPRLVRNIQTAQTLATSAGLKLRPHAKTHKSPVIASWQIEGGAVGVCCAKLGEAEVFVAAGTDHIQPPYPGNPANASRPPALWGNKTIPILLDHRDAPRRW